MNNTFDVTKFVADNAGLNIFEALEKAYNQGQIDIVNHLQDLSEISEKDATDFLTTFNK